MIPVAVKCTMQGLRSPDGHTAAILTVCVKTPVYSRTGSLYDYTSNYCNFTADELGKFKSLDQVADYVLFDGLTPVARKLSKEIVAQKGARYCHYQELAPEIRRLVTLNPFGTRDFESWSRSYPENMRL